MKTNWLKETYGKLDQVLAEYDISIRGLAELAGPDVKYSWLIKFVHRGHANPTITRVQVLHDTLDEILEGK